MRRQILRGAKQLRRALAVVGGNDADQGECPAVAEITYGVFQFTGTLIAPDKVLSAGHCSSLTGAAVSSPAAWPAPLVDVRIGDVRPGQGERVPVRSIAVHPDYGADHDRPLLRRRLQQLRRDDDGLCRLPGGRRRHLPGRLRRPALRARRRRRAARRRLDVLRRGLRPSGKPGVYARVADGELREWTRSQAPAGVN